VVAQLPKLLCNVYSIYIFYKCGHRQQETTWWVAGWTPLVKKELVSITGNWIYWPETMENVPNVSHVRDNNYLLIIYDTLSEILRICQLKFNYLMAAAALNVNVCHQRLKLKRHMFLFIFIWDHVFLAFR
jgi:hypothetical protein